MNHARLGPWLRIVGLPVLLVLLVAIGLGSYYETNDDVVITLLLRGRTAAAPVTNLHLYFHGWSWLLAKLYTTWPAVPWYGLVLYGLLTLALVLLFAVLERLMAQHVRSGWARAGLLTFFFFAAALEHVLWFNYMRVPLLLAGAAVLFAAQHSTHGRRWSWMTGVMGVAAAWAIRPSAAILAVAVVAPAAWWVAGRRGSQLLLLVAVLFAAGSAGLAFSRSPESARYRRLDVLKSNYSDYQLYRAAPQTPADRLAVSAVQEWLLGDSTLVNEAFFERVMRPDVPYFLQHQAPLKLGLTLRQLLRDYFLVLLMSALLAGIAFRQQRPVRGAWLYPVAVVLGLLALGVVLKLPPRLALPLLGLMLVAQVAALAQQPLPRLRPWWRALGVGLLVIAVGLYGYKTVHRVGVLRQEQREHAVALTSLSRQAGGRTVIAAGLEETFKALSPFANYDQPTNGRWLLLTGWPAPDPSQPQLRQYLAGSRDQAAALRHLLTQPDVVVWWPPNESVANLLRQYAKAHNIPPALVQQSENLYLLR